MQSNLINKISDNVFSVKAKTAFASIGYSGMLVLPKIH